MSNEIDDIPQEWESVARELFVARFEAMRHYRAIKYTEHLHPSKTKHLICHGRSNPIYSFAPNRMDTEWMDESYKLFDDYITRIQHHLRLMQKYFQIVKEKDEWLRNHHCEYWKKHDNSIMTSKFIMITKPTINNDLEDRISNLEKRSIDTEANIDSLESRVSKLESSDIKEEEDTIISSMFHTPRLKKLANKIIKVVKRMGAIYK